MTNISNVVDAVQEVATEVSPAPVEFKRITPAGDVIARLDWGEPAFTMIDVRDRESYNNERVMGAIPMTIDELVDRVNQTLEQERDIYVYGTSDQQAIHAATELYQAGFENVAVLEGGLSAWKTANGPVEGRNG